MRIFLCLLLLTSCSSYIASAQEEKRRSDILYDEMRIEIADLKHSLNATQVEMNILEERVRKQENTSTQVKKEHSSDVLAHQFSLLEKKLASLQIIQEQLVQDMQLFRSHTKDVNLSLQNFADQIQIQNKKFEEISRLKTTLSSLSKVMEPTTTSTKTYTVRAGDTLERIAQKNNTTVAHLKKFNHLEDDRIKVGQELKLP